MEKNASTWHPGLTKRTKTENKKQQPNKIQNVNSHMHCKVGRVCASQISEEVSISKWRFQTDYPVFKVYHYSFEDNQQGEFLAKIVYELPDTLLSNLHKPVFFPNCLYILKTLLMASQKLIQQFGYFKLTQKMVGITKQKACKLWIHESIQKNKVMYPASSQQQTVNSIKQIIYSLLGEDELQIKFAHQLKKEQHTIVRANQLIWQFSYEYSLLIPPFFSSNQYLGKTAITSNYCNIAKNMHHKKTQSLVPSPSAKKRRTQGQNNQNKSQHRYSQLQGAKQGQQFHQNNLNKPFKNVGNFQKKNITNSNSNLNKVNMAKNNDKPKDFAFLRQKSTVKLNKSSHSNLTSLVGSPRNTVQVIKSRANSKSDFINRKNLERRQSIDTDKQNLTKTTSSKIAENIQNGRKQSESSGARGEENKQKMKNMVKQKLRQNREKKKVVKLQAINTVKSIGQFTQSEKRILQQSNHSKSNNLQLQVLNLMCRKIGTSYFNIEIMDSQSQHQQNGKAVLANDQ